MATATYIITPVAATPTFSPTAGTFSAAQTVTIADTTPGASIYYTTNGSAPTTSSNKYAASISVSSTETVSAMATATGYANSAVAAATYTIANPCMGNVATNANGNIYGVPSGDGLSCLTFTYNNANRPASVVGGTVGATFLYDWEGQRYSKTNGGMSPTVYSYSQDGSVIAENDGGTVTDYIYVDGRPIALVQPSASSAANQIGYVTTDRLGTPQRVTNSGGSTIWTTSYQPFGATGIITASVEQNLRFPGQLADPETGFSYNLNRDYMPNLGRYLESDPAGFGGGMNIYAYAADTPFVHIDRKGLDFFGTSFLPPNISVPDLYSLPPGVNPFGPDLPPVGIPRLPDSYTLTFTGGDVAGGGAALTVDVYGNAYISGVGVISTPSPLSFSLSANYYGSVFNSEPTEQCLTGMIVGPSSSYGGGAILGYGVSDVSQSFSLTTPGVGYQYSYTIPLQWHF